MERQPPSLERALSDQVERLLRTEGFELRRLAAILGAEQYLTVERNGLRLNVRDFIHDRVAAAGVLRLPRSIATIKTVILPPGEGELSKGGGAGLETPKIIPRTQYTMEVLGQLGIAYVLVDGQVTTEMVRQQSYVIFILQERGILLFVNNEEGNATYVIYRVEDPETQWLDYARKTKPELRDMARATPPQADFFEYYNPPGFKTRLAELLTHEPTPKPLPRPSSRRPPSATEALPESPLHEPAPPGWLTLSGIAIEFGKGRDWVVERLGKIGLTIEGEKYFLDGIRRLRPHFSPETVDSLRAMAKAVEPAPPGWLTLRAISLAIGKKPRWISSRLANMDLTDQDIKNYLDAGEHSHTHYSPNVVSRLRTMAEAYKPAPPGWLTVTGIAKKNEKDINWVQSRLAAISLTDDNKQPFLDSAGRVADHYSPNIVELLTNMAQANEPAPPGWLSSYGIMQALNKSRHWVELRLAKINITNKNSGEYLDKGGHHITHYSPEVIDALRRMIEI